MNTLKQRFQTQKWHAVNNRGIEWNLTFEEWLDIWGDKITQRGRGTGKYNMCRINDIGPYSIDNVFIDLHEDNANNGNHKSKMRKVKIHGKTYNSIVEASHVTGIPGWKIQRYAKKQNTGVEYVI